MIGFVGLGKMGRPIAERLLDLGHSIRIPDNRAQAGAEALIERGAIREVSPAAVARQSETIFTCVMWPRDLEELVLGVDGIADVLRPGATIVDLSTIDPMTTRRVGEALSRRGVHFLDAPVSGGPERGRNGTLSIMVGGERDVFDRLDPLLRQIGEPSKVFHVGLAGAGVTAKLCNQILSGVGAIAVAEVMVLGVKGGLDPQQLYEVLSASSGASRSLDRNVPNFILPRRFNASFALDGIAKDLACAASAATTWGVDLEMTNAARAIYRRASAEGLGHLDASAVVQLFERVAGVEVSGGGNSLA